MTDTNTAEREALMNLADAYAEASFDQGLYQRTEDDAPEEARAKLEKALRDALAGRASLAASAGSEPVKRVFLVHTGEEHEGEATYTRHDDAPPPLCDSECLYTAAPTPAAQADSVLEDADRWRMAVLVGKEVMLHPEKRTHANAVKAYMDAVHSGLDLTGAVDAARKQGAKHDNT